MSECPKCGLPHPRCDKHNRQGKPCGHVPLSGTTTCPKHAGKKKSVIREEVAARRGLAALDLSAADGVNPLQELLNEVLRASVAVEWLGAKVNDLDDREITHGVLRTVQAADGTRTTTAAASVNVWVKLWQTERDRLARACKLTLDAGVDERMVRLAEGQGRMIVNVLTAALEDLGVTPSDDVNTVVARHLRAVGA